MKRLILLASLCPLIACVHPHQVPVLQTKRKCAPGTVPSQVQYCHAVRDDAGNVIVGKMKCDPIQACGRLDTKGQVLAVFPVGAPNTFDDTDADDEINKDALLSKRAPWWKFWRKRDNKDAD